VAVEAAARTANSILDESEARQSNRGQMIGGYSRFCRLATCLDKPVAVVPGIPISEMSTSGFVSSTPNEWRSRPFPQFDLGASEGAVTSATLRGCGASPNDQREILSRRGTRVSAPGTAAVGCRTVRITRWKWRGAFLWVEADDGFEGIPFPRPSLWASNTCRLKLYDVP